MGIIKRYRNGLFTLLTLLDDVVQYKAFPEGEDDQLAGNSCFKIVNEQESCDHNFQIAPYATDVYLVLMVVNIHSVN